MPSTTTLTQGTYVIDPARSTITGRTRAMFGLAPVKATFSLESGTLRVAEDPSLSQATAVIKANSFGSGNAKRDHHITSADFLHAEKFPTIEFASTSVSRAASGWTLRGNLTVRGETRPIELAVTSIDVTDNTLTAEANTSIDRHQFGISKAKGMAGGTLSLVVSVTATRS